MKYYQSSITRRIGAFLIDTVAVIAIAMSLSIVMAIVTGLFSDSRVASMILSLIIMLSIIFYQPIMETFFNGCTIGKKAMSIRVVSTDGSTASGLQCLQRFMLMPVDLYFTLGVGALVSTMVTEKRQRLGDLTAGTMVVYYSPQYKAFDLYLNAAGTMTSPEEQAIYGRIDGNVHITAKNHPLELAKAHRSIECDLSRLRTLKSNNNLIEYLERVLSSVHLAMFRHRSYTWSDLAALVMRSVPRAVYESRRCIYLSLAIAILSFLIGVYSQHSDHEFFSEIMGYGYASMTESNIAAGKPMGVYGDTDELTMFFEIFMNNFMVSVQLYMYGIFILIGPLFFLIDNFVMVGVFDTFFAQKSLLGEALMAINMHGVIELSSIIMVGGAAIRLGTGWLFPGRLTRLKAWSRAARHSILIFVSTVPMLLVAAFIESFITRHTEWPMLLRLIIILTTTILIIGYYVMLPIIAKRQ